MQNRFKNEDSFKERKNTINRLSTPFIKRWCAFFKLKKGRIREL